VSSLSLSDVGLIAIVCLLADLGIAVLGTLLASLALFSRARELLLPVLFLPSLVPVVIAAAGATHAVAGGANDLAEYRGYCLFLGIYALTFALVAYATYEVVFDDAPSSGRPRWSAGRRPLDARGGGGLRRRARGRRPGDHPEDLLLPHLDRPWVARRLRRRLRRRDPLPVDPERPGRRGREHLDRHW